MPEPSLARPLHLLGIAPELPAQDLAATKAWYERHLGFHEVGRWQEWDFLILEREGHRLHFSRAARPGHEGVLYVRLREGVDDLSRALSAAGALTAHGPEDKAWGMREFVAYDPDGRAVRIRAAAAMRRRAHRRGALNRAHAVASRPTRP